MKFAWIIVLLFISVALTAEEPLAKVDDASVYELLTMKLAPAKFADILKRAEAGDPAAIDAVSMGYLYGMGTRPSVRKALEWLQRGFDKRSPIAVLYQAKSYAGFWLMNNGEDPVEAKRIVDPVVPFFRGMAAKGFVIGETLLGQALWVTRDKEALQHFKKSADAGEVIAQLCLGDALFRGEYVEKDTAGALVLFRKAADQGSPIGFHDLGVWYKNTDPAGSAKSYLKAAELGYSPSAENIGIYYRDGNGVASDPLEALRWLIVAERDGIHHFRYLDTYDPDDPEYKKRTPAEILKWFTDKAESGSIPQMEAVGLYYFSGFGLPKDANKAAAMLEKAVALGDSQSVDDLMEVYSSTAQFDKIFLVSKKAAGMGTAMGQVHLAVCYERGWGTPRDYKKALEYFEKAVQLGYRDRNGKVAELRGLAKAFGAEEEKLSALEKEAEAGDVKAMMRVAINYENGNIVPRDIAKAVAWEEKAAAAGSFDACAKIGGRYASGDDVTIDLYKAYDFLQKAAASGEVRHLYNLGRFLQKNQELKPSTRKDLFEAFLAAANKGDQQSILQVARCYNWGTGTPENCTEAIAWYEKIMDIDFRPGFEAGMILVLGRGGVAQDVKRGAKMVEKAAQDPRAGDPQLELGKLYKDGIGVEKDTAKAMEWLKKSKDNGNATAGHLLQDLMNPTPPEPAAPAKPKAPSSADF